MAIEDYLPTEQITARVHHLQEQVGEKAKQLGSVTDHYVHENAWKTLAIAVVIGLALGLLLRPGRD